MERLAIQQLKNLLRSRLLLRHLEHHSQRALIKHHQQKAWFSVTPACQAGLLKNIKNKKKDPIIRPKKKSRGVVEIRPNLTVADLADRLKLGVDHVFNAMSFIEGTQKYTKPHKVIDNMDVIKDIVRKSGFQFKMEAKNKEEEIETVLEDVVKRPPIDPKNLVKRAPVVTVMGHVDHGKTTLLDSLRKTNVVAQEFGGITQHIGAFSVKMSSGETITFLDTPGHAAFSAMRARGAHVTDIIILVVAADDGVMQQTEESIKHAQEANVPIIVAINKIDKAHTDLDRVKQELLQKGVQLEELGGEVQAIPISAKEGTNLDQLQEAIIAQAEVLEIKADPTGLVEGAVIESRVDARRGKLSTALVQRGTMKKGALLVAGTSWAKVRAMFNDRGEPVHLAAPGTPVEILGWRDLPSAGDGILQMETEPQVKEVINCRLALKASKKIEENTAIIQKKAEDNRIVYKEHLSAKHARGERRARKGFNISSEPSEKDNLPNLSIVLKGDVDGSVEAILDTLDTYDSQLCTLDVIHYGVGMVTEQDVELAASFSGLVYAFNVPIMDTAKKLSASTQVPLKKHNVIYKLIDDLKDELNKKLPTKPVDEIIGEAVVLQTFDVQDGKKKLSVAGCLCSKGLLNRKKHCRLIRDEKVIYDGELSSLRHFKNEVETIKKGVECGLSFNDPTVKPQNGDTIICYQVNHVEQTIDWELRF